MLKSSSSDSLDFLIGLDLARIMELNLAGLSASLYKPDACSFHAASVSCFLLFH
jgi:hypothetical protein